MLKRIALQLSKKAHKLVGYEVIKEGSRSSVQLYDYRQNGEFDYNSYKDTQIAGNKRKIENVWVNEENIKFISAYLDAELKKIQFGLCHGTRRGLEQKWFAKYLHCTVIGTEISDTATEFENTIEWDFHNVKDEWINAVDFIYSNSFDHSYDPKACINAWADCLRSGGICVIEHTSGHEKATKLDPFGAKIQLLPYLLTTWLHGKCSVVDVLDSPVLTQNQSYVKFVVLQKRQAQLTLFNLDGMAYVMHGFAVNSVQHL